MNHLVRYKLIPMRYFPFRLAFLLTSPAVAVYLLSYFFIIQVPNQPTTSEPPGQIQADQEREKLLPNTADEDDVNTQGTVINCPDKKIFQAYNCD